MSEGKHTQERWEGFVVPAGGAAGPPAYWCWITGHSPEFVTLDKGLRVFTPKSGRLIAEAPAMLEALDPEFLETIADEIDCFEHSARTAGLRSLAKKQRAVIARAKGEQP